MNEILRCSNIHKAFNKSGSQKLEIIKGVSLSIEKGKISVIVGKSGAGKSTLLHILGGLDNPDKGSVIVDDVELHKLNDDKLSDFRNGNIGFVFQFQHLLPEFTALENINIPQMISGKNKEESSKRSIELLEIVGLSDRKDHRPSELSGGEQQRVAIARALANNPKIVFADEPTGNLDSANSMIIHELITELKLKFDLTFLIVTHNKSLIDLGDKVFEMRDG
ncbi:MAG: ABC transporter ATP-binding protein, partial [Bacteroidota bacterium]